MTDVASTRSAVADAAATRPERLARHSLVWLAIFFALGLTLALAVQLVTVAPDALGGTLVAQLMNAHALLLVFFCGLPALTHVFGQALLPAAVGRGDHAFPMLALWAHRLHAIGGMAVVSAIALGAVPGRWSLVGTEALAHGTAGALLAVGLHLVALSMVAVALNHLATLLTGERDADVAAPVVAWTFGVAALVALALAPAMASWSVLFLVQGTGSTLFGTGAAHSLATFERLFDFVEFGAGLFAVVVSTGLALQVLVDSAAQRLDLGGRVGPALGAFALLGLFAAGYPLGQDADTAVVGSALRLAMAIPAAVLIHAVWEVARNGIARVDAALLHTLAFVVHVAVVAGSGLVLASLATGPVLLGTKFQVAHQHLVFAGCALAIFFAAGHRWWPALFGHALDERLGVAGAALVFAGTQMAFLPALILGGRGLLAGRTDLPADVAGFGVLEAFGAVVLTVGVLLEGWAILKSVQAMLADSGRGDATA